jgi:hypothetical protein
MVYGGSSPEEEAKHIWVTCDHCKKRVLVKDCIEWYDENDCVSWWDGKLKPKLKTFCTNSCKINYKGG